MIGKKSLCPNGLFLRCPFGVCVYFPVLCRTVVTYRASLWMAQIAVLRNLFRSCCADEASGSRCCSGMRWPSRVVSCRVFTMTSLDSASLSRIPAPATLELETLTYYTLYIYMCVCVSTLLQIAQHCFLPKLMIRHILSRHRTVPSS